MANPSTSSSVFPTDPKYKGVRKRKWGKYVSEIRLPNSRERIWLGSYDSAEKAARAFDAAQFCLRGDKGSFNFPDNPPKISQSRPMKMTPQEIQIEAAKYANEEAAGKSSSADEAKSGNNNNNNAVAEQCTTSSVSDGAVQEMDWSFLDALDCNVESDYGLYAGIGDISGVYQPLPPSEPVDDGVDEQYGEETVFSSQSSFLWNF